jgi:small subunit ribosomal protein S5
MCAYRERNDRRRKEKEVKVFDKDAWIPKTELGKRVKAGEIATLDDVFKLGKKLMEPEIVDCFIPDLQMKIIDVKKTTRVTRAGRHFSFRVSVIIGDGNGHIGVGTGKNIERIIAQEKAIKDAKLNIVPVRRGCGSWECNCSKKHSVPYKVLGKCASLRVELIPAPNGIGLAVSDTIKPIFDLVGIKDLWSNTRGATDTKLNFTRATIDALYKISDLRTKEKEIEVEKKEEQN